MGSEHPDWTTVDDAITTLINQCLRDSGLTFQQNLPSTQNRPGEDTEFDVLNVILADSDNYGLAEYLEVQRTFDGRELAEVSIPPGEEDLIAVALWGGESAPRVRIEDESGIVTFFPTTGCQAQAQEEVHEVSVEVYERTRVGLPSITEVVEKVTSDPDLATLEVEWAQCMSDVGYNSVHTLADFLDTIFDTYATHAEEPDGVAQLASWEADVAAADSGCRTETSFGDAVMNSFVFHGQQILNGHQEMFALARQIEMDALENAKAILSTS